MSIQAWWPGVLQGLHPDLVAYLLFVGGPTYGRENVVPERHQGPAFG